MFKNKFVIGLIIAVIVGVIGYTFLGEETTVSDADYVLETEQERKDKDKFFRDSEESPFRKTGDFKGINYFPPNSTYRVIATVVPYHATDTKVTVPMTDGTTVTYEKYGFAEFTFPGESAAADLNVYRLLIYKHESGLSPPPPKKLMVVGVI